MILRMGFNLKTHSRSYMMYSSVNAGQDMSLANQSGCTGSGWCGGSIPHVSSGNKIRE